MNNNKTYIGIDNGVTGSIGIISNNKKPIFLQTPIKKEQNYTKNKQNISRLMYDEFYDIMEDAIVYSNNNRLVIIERPMVNNKRFKSTVSAVRCLEAQLICLEKLSLPYIYIDSKEWQKKMLPSGIKESSKLKKASLDIGCRLFPSCKEIIIKQKDADGLLIAEYARLKNL